MMDGKGELGLERMGLATPPHRTPPDHCRGISESADGWVDIWLAVVQKAPQGLLQPRQTGFVSAFQVGP